MTQIVDRVKELVEFWKSEGKRCYDLAHKRTKVEETVMAQSVRFWECARELESLISDLEKLEAELVALKEVGPCGKHPKACRREAQHFCTPTGHCYDCIREGCTACERTRLERTVALRKAATSQCHWCKEGNIPTIEEDFCQPGKLWHKIYQNWLMCAASETLALIPAEDASLADAHDAETREPLLAALREIREVVVTACGQDAPYIKIALARLDSALKGSK